jgi:hypothetical protein
VAVLEQPQRVLAGEYLPRSEIRVVAVWETTTTRSGKI